ncbi:hypothetical protein ACOCJ5_07295 [Knoellia sp. CPCC 206450]|uniref:hypothetical protein n=1 Tax=Knoellia tibetensis TaxID=3404798 RepID=UPI003B4319FA
MSKFLFVFFRASYGWPLTVGVILAATLAQRDKLPAAGVILAAAVVVALVVFLRTDLPKLRTMDEGSS